MSIDVHTRKTYVRRTYIHAYTHTYMHMYVSGLEFRLTAPVVGVPMLSSVSASFSSIPFIDMDCCRSVPRGAHWAPSVHTGPISTRRSNLPPPPPRPPPQVNDPEIL
jgi:hypothetical protein